MHTRLWKKPVALLLIVTLASGCTSLRPVSSEPVLITSSLRTGDSIQITMRDGRVLELTIKAITERSISGENEQVEVSDIVRIDRHELSLGRTAGVTVVLAMTVILISGILLFASMYRNGM